MSTVTLKRWSGGANIIYITRGRGAILLGGLLLYVYFILQPLRQKHFVLEQIAGFTDYVSNLNSSLISFFLIVGGLFLL